MNFYDTLSRWNLWGKWQLPKSYPRKIKDDICQYLDIEEILALIGPRRAGKSTILYQVMQYLLEQKIDASHILHINFEEPELSPLLKVNLLDQLYDCYRAQVNPKEKAYLFLDEIQNIPQWERWVRSRNDTENIKILITGSSSQLMSRELATVLTGRNLVFDIHPLSFSEVLDFKNIILPSYALPNKPPAEIQNALINYLQWGGYPRVVLAKDDHEREQLLKRYFDEIILKDVVQRYEIRDAMALRNIAIHLLTNTATLVSYKRLGDIFQVSADLAKNYTHYLNEAFIIDLLSFYSLKASERTRNPLKVHAIDLGIRKVISLSTSPDLSKLLETQVYTHCLRKYKDRIFYWKGKGEVDLIIQEETTISQLIQVVYQDLENENVLKREINSLKEAMKNYPKAKPYLITWELPNKINTTMLDGIEIIPLWHFLLMD